MPLQILHADVSHAAIIATMGKKTFRRTFGELFHSKEELFEYLEKTYDPLKLARSIRKEGNLYLLAYLNDEPAGFAKIKTHSLNEQIASIAQMELQKIYVLPEKQGCGVGTALLIEVKNLAREIAPDYIWLDTHISNERAIRFYERNGFNRIGSFDFTIGSQIFEYHLMAFPWILSSRRAC